MNWIDTSIIVITSLSCVFGLWRGLVKEVLSLVTWIAALLMAKGYSELFAEILAGVIDNNSIRLMAAFAIIFIAVMMLGTFINFLMSKLLVVTGLKLTDRLLGGIFGAARGMLIVLVGLFFSGIVFSESEEWQESIIIPHGLTMLEWSRVFIGDIDNANMVQ